MSKPLLSVFSLGALLAFNLSAQQAVLNVVHGFSGADGANPASSLIELTDGSLLGVTLNLQSSKQNGGTIFVLNPSGALQTKFTFAIDGSQCQNVSGAVTDNGILQASDGNFYGVCYQGGKYGVGLVYRFSRTGTFRVLHNFAGADGINPLGPLVEGTDGNLYGVTASIGKRGASSPGSLFRITFDGTFTSLYTFTHGGPAEPGGGLAMGFDGNLYGLTIFGPTLTGAAYQLTTAGAFSVTSTYRASPFTLSPAISPDNTLYSLNQPTVGVANVDETLQAVPPGGSARVVYGLPNSFGPDFVNLVGGMIFGSDGALYLNGNSIIENPVNPTLATRIDYVNGQTQFLALDNASGQLLVGSPLQTSSGKFYAAAQNGGPNGLGSIISLDYGLAPPPPAILSFQPASGGPGTPVTIWGAHFVGATSVTVGGISVPFTAVASGFIKFGVNNKAVTGPITVTTPAGVVSSSSSFTVN